MYSKARRGYRQQYAPRRMASSEYAMYMRKTQGRRYEEDDFEAQDTGYPSATHSMLVLFIFICFLLVICALVEIPLHTSGKSSWPSTSSHKPPVGQHANNHPHFRQLQNNFNEQMSGQNKPLKKFDFRESVDCRHEDSDAHLFETSSVRPATYIVINEPRSGSSWLQEMSQFHPGIKVQFELDMMYGNSALQCMSCPRARIPDSKNLDRVPPKIHPPLACGMTIFGQPNSFEEVASVANARNASLIILLRRNHVARAISSYLHFSVALGGVLPFQNAVIPWESADLQRHARKIAEGYDKLAQFPARTARPAHLIFYEDLKARPAEVWAGLLRFLGLPDASAVGAPASDLAGLERRSTNKPSSRYLGHREGIARELAGTEWGDMLDDDSSSVGGGYDGRLDLEGEFVSLCARFPEARMSWRRQRCVGGKVEAIAS